MATQYSNKPIVTNGLVYALDFGNQKSYVSGSTSARSLLFNPVTASVIPFLPVINQLAQFTGSQYIDTNIFFSGLQLETGNGTVMFVVQGSRPTYSDNTVFSQHNGVAVTDRIGSMLSPTQISYGSEYLPSITRLYNGNYSTLKHFTFRLSSGSLDCFVNGIPVSASAYGAISPSNNGSTSLKIGSRLRSGTTGEQLSGSLGLFQVYNRPLTSDEIWNNYQLAAPRYGLGPLQNKPYSLDENAYLFLQSAGITDPIITSSINTFVLGLKSASLWDKMIAIYPFVGTGSVGVNLTGSQRWNLKEPSLVTYPLSFTGSWNGSVSGSTPSGSGTNITAGGITPSTYYPNYSSSNAHISILSYDTPTSSSMLAGTGMTRELAVSTLAGDYGTPAAAYSVRKVRTAYSGALMDVRRSIDNVTSSIGYVSNGDLDTGSLSTFVNAVGEYSPGSYSGLAAAYSLRKVSASYSGFAIDVRRDSDNTTSSIGFNVTGGLDTGALLSFVTGSANTGSGFVAQWYDQSGNARHATQTTESKQPVIVSSGSLITLQGKPSVYFDDTDDAMSTTTLLNRPYAVFLLAQQQISSYIQRIINSPTRNSLIAITRIQETVAAAGDIASASIGLVNTPYVVSLVNDTTSSQVYSNTVNKTTTLNNNDFGVMNFGALGVYNEPAQAFVSEIIAYTGSSQVTSRPFIENNINTYYNVYTSSNAGYVARWYDQSGNNRHATQTATGSQPVIVESGSVISSGTRPSLYWKTTGLDNLEFSRISNIQTVFHISQLVETGSNQSYLLGDTVNFDYAAGTGDPQKWLYDITPAVYNGSNFINGISYNFITTNRNLNRNLLTLIHTSAVGISNQISIDRGNPRSWRGYIQEITLYTSSQASNRQAVEYGINNYYNIYPQTSSFTTSSFAIYATSGSVSASLNNDLVSGISSTGPLGFITVSRTGSNSLTIARNGVTSSFAVPASGALSTGIYLGAINNNGLALANSPLNISFASVGTGLTNSEVRTLNNLTTKLQLDLQRVSVLDQYPGARSAYSVRKLSKNYTGSAIQVIRSSDNAIADIGFNGFDLDTTTLLNFVGSGTSNHGYVRTWYDQSGFNNHVTQSTHTAGANVAIVLSGSLVTQGTKPALYMNTQNMIGTVFTASEFSTYMVGNINGSCYAGYFYNRTTTGYSFTFINDACNTQWRSALIRYSASVDSSWPESLHGSSYRYPAGFTGRLIETWNFSGSRAASEYAINGSNVTIGGASANWAGTSGRYRVGPTGYSSNASGQVYLQEFIIYDRKQTSAIAIQDNLDQYFEVY